MIELKQSTEITIRVGPFVDPTDPETAEAGLVGTGTEISKAGAAYAAGPVLGVYDADGFYPVTLTTTHTNTLGALQLKSLDAAHLPVFHDYMVLTANQWDSKYSTDILNVNVGEVSGDAGAADALELIALTAKGADHKILVSADAQDLSGSFDVNTKTLTAGVVDATAIGTDAIDADALKADAAEQIADQVWEETQAAHVAVGSFGEIATEIASILDDTNELQVDDIPGTLSTMDGKLDTAQTDLDTITGTGGVLIGTDVMDRSGTLDVNTKTITADAINAAAAKTDFVEEIRNAITGGAYAIDTDANGRVRLVVGSGAGEIELSSGRVDLGEIMGGAVPAPATTGVPDVNLVEILDVAATASVNDILDVNVLEWKDVPLATTNPLPNAAPDAAGGLPVSDAGGLDIDTLLGLINGALPEIAGAATCPTTPTPQQALMLLYMMARNACQSTASERRVMNNAGTEILDAAMSDDGTTFDQGKLGAP